MSNNLGDYAKLLKEFNGSINSSKLKQFGLFKVNISNADDCFFKNDDYVVSKGFFEDFNNVYNYVDSLILDLSISNELNKLVQLGTISAKGNLEICSNAETLSLEGVVKKKGLKELFYHNLSLCLNSGHVESYATLIDSNLSHLNESVKYTKSNLMILFDGPISQMKQDCIAFFDLASIPKSGL
ncbi:hypothetical protein K9L97_02690 [Candidatus Woesearchaeota archaeon]|nr:hypothetical protein [Candidatus Woesearchaeota archaeon]